MISGARGNSIPLRREDIQLSDKDILRRYMGIDDIPCSIQSPLREDDYRPSFSLFEERNIVFWKDFGTGDSGTVITLMAKLWHVNYKEALLKIKLDTENTVPRFSLIRKYNGKIHLNSKSSIKVRIRDWQDWDREYWNSYGISEKFCKWCNVYPVSHAFFTREEDNRTICVPMDKYAYAYFEWKDGVESIKLYQPYSVTLKWLSKHDSSVWDLWKHAFKWAKNVSNDSVIITSSRKDAMCLWHNLGIPAMSLQGEGYVPKPQVMKQVLDTFKTVYIWYDNDFSHEKDNPGQDNAKKLIEKHPSLKNVCIPKKYKCKDPSDFYKKYGPNALRDIWKKLK